jgi:hypothetical protein
MILVSLLKQQSGKLKHREEAIASQVSFLLNCMEGFLNNQSRLYLDKFFCRVCICTHQATEMAGE